MALKIFPIGVQDFAKLRNDGKYYVDKTDLIYKLTHTSDYYFMSRPRRFGKSLLLSTLECYFQGRKELFTGLAIEDLEKEWKKHPVFKISFAKNKYPTKRDLLVTLQSILAEFEKTWGVEVSDAPDWGMRLENVVKAAVEKTSVPAVLLIDEYDAPLLYSIDNLELQAELREEVRKLFAPIKDLGGILRFVFITGISKFSQLSIFSELNNLDVITMNEEYAGLCGITREELLSQMKPEIQALADKNGMSYEKACKQLKHQYNGYHFAKNLLDVYNPFSLIKALAYKNFDNHWFSTGTPTMLVKAIKKYKMDPEMFDRGFPATLEMFDTPLETATDPIAVLYQSGYLTIKAAKGKGRYVLGFPNNEVRIGFLKSLMPNYAYPEVSKNETRIMELSDAFEENNIDRVLTLVRATLSEVPYTAERQDEAHFKTLVFFFFRLCSPYLVQTEVCSAAGRADVVVETDDAVYVFEFKLDGNATVEDALRQIDDKGYLIPYTATMTEAGTPKALYKIGVSFDSAHRTIGDWKIVKV